MASIVRDPAVDVAPGKARTIRPPRVIAAVAIVLCLLNLALAYPGQLVPDSAYQYRQSLDGHYGDMHPPVMAWLWSWMGVVWHGPASMFVFQVVLYWLGFGLVAAALARSGRVRTGWTVMALSLFPYFAIMDTVILKDTGLTVSYLACFAAAFRYRILARPLPKAVLALCWLLLAYGTLVRHNAVFAFGPLALYLAGSRLAARPLQLAAISIVLAMLAVPAGKLVNQHLIGALPNGSIRLLQVYDLAGIAYVSGDPSVLGEASGLTMERVQDCYTPYFGDSLLPWGVCPVFWDRLGVTPAVRDNPFEMQYQNPALTGMWLRAIASHPLAYIGHRLLVTNSAFMVLVPVAQYDYGPVTTGLDILTAPVIWLIVAGCLFSLLLTPRTRLTAAPPVFAAATVLLVSGGLYLAAYAVISIGTSIRFQYWSAVAIAVALVLLLPVLADHYRRRTALVIGWTAALVCVAGLCAWARLTHDYRLFLPTMTGKQLEVAACLQSGGETQDCIGRTYFKPD